MVKPIHRPGAPLTSRATSVSGPSRPLRRSATLRLSTSVSYRRKVSLGSRGAMRRPSSSARVLMSETRAIESECTSAARLRLTSEASWLALCRARGSYSSARKVCSQATMQPTSKQRQKEEGAPEQADPPIGAHLQRRRRRLQRGGLGFKRNPRLVRHQALPSGTNT